MPFNLYKCTAPSTFQRCMELVLTDLDWSSCFVYLDNISLFTAAPLKNASLTDEIDRSAQQAETAGMS